MKIFCKILDGYNSRDLTFDADIHNTLAGTLYNEAVALPGGLIHGLPKRYFDIALLWQPFWFTGIGEPRRRIPESATNLVLPSWSWAGWQTSLDLSPWHRCGPPVPMQYSSFSSGGSWRTERLVDWNQVTACGRYYVRINQKLPQTSSRSKRLEHASRSSAGHHPVSSEESLTLHASEPAKASIAKISDKTTLLFCRTHRAFMKTKELLSPKHRDVLLADPLSNQPVGVVRLNWVPQVERSQDKTTGQTKYLYEEKCELIAISTGRTREHAFLSILNRPYFGEWKLKESVFFDGFYQFYNVMWIEWKDGIAYRKAVGRVVKHVWESQQLEEIDVILG